ncbi:MAG: heat-inducible transcriptional repressor HrcA [Thiomonas sp.]|jgi:heat-inducible transcriptional repressor|uniref:Heat-inducible transcription repressor HrcA n=1 Tax=Thiomonas intermedia (strain K12) TaxID=75379 RepID=D5WYK0_THIK1|nr:MULTISPECIES: heat-inducible transcriptional repressor HrcA [Thiomonas]MDE1978374.1 heat-inducible transcriptional repressor HrcA [Betaproteobacteria bacterium]CQR43241.1 Heat-inducible transcription repressor HrcA [Thiomonas sp. CB3]MBN8775100.1 heat-inducible transcriptional repressor HrcA [Thiomonas arsenitoxydans]MDE2175113.1 heat-inducible transcriptional repressor HrcA [Betaproteobacteria bacterium]MDE2269609.1 heat-inducible transcriptional repressor HrcA [Betaproteobacteria bacteriu
MDERARLLLKTLIEHYIADGQPVGSRTLSRASGLELSAATIRNVMADLEDMGLIASPHTSAGRIPTPRGYRVFVDAMLTAQPQMPTDLLPQTLQQHIDTAPPQQVMMRAAQLMSSLSQFVGVVLAPQRSAAFRHIEFLRLSEHRILLIIVSPEGDVQNRMLHWPHALSQNELNTATNYLNAHFSGLSFEQVTQKLGSEVEHLRSELVALMQAGVQAGSQALQQPQDQVVISGQQQLLGIGDFAGNLGKLRQLFDLFEQKAQLLKLMDASARADGVRIYIGGESEAVPFEELSVITAPYAADGKVVGTLGVIGPTRMAYDRMIQIVDITSKLVGNALSQR